MDVLQIVLVWIVASMSFLAGAAWNADAYDHGYRDGLNRGHREG